MGTITQEIDRINGGKNSIIESTNIKLEAQGSQPIPANTKIDEISPYIDAIQQGGEENAFLQKTNLDYTFYYSDLTEHGNFEALKRLSQNNITSLSSTFGYASYTQQTDFDEFLEYLRRILTNATITNAENMLAYLKLPAYNTQPQNIPVLDLSNLKINGSALGAFDNIMQPTSSDNKYLKIKFKKDVFKNCTHLTNAFTTKQYATNITYIFEDNEINCSKSKVCAYMFSDFKGKIEDFNGNVTNTLNLKMNQSGTYSLYSAFSNTSFERINFDNTIKCISFTNTFNRSTNLKSITGLNFEGYTTTSFSPFGTYDLPNFGELGIINGSTLGTTGGRDLNIKVIWNANKSTIRDGQTIEYWYEKFANTLGNSEGDGTQKITISSALYNSLTQAQIELITNKGYMLASA